MIALGYNNLIEAATLSGGAWETDYPITNIQTQPLGQRARSTSTTATIVVTLGAATAIGAVAVAGNMTPQATIQVQAGAYDSTALTGTAVAVDPAVTEAVWTITITDAGNADGFVAVGRVFIGGIFTAATCVDWGMTFGLMARTEVAESIGGQEFFNVRKPRRTWSGKWSWLTEAEAFDGMLAMQLSHDIWKEICIVDSVAQYGFLGRLRQLSSIEYPYPLINAVAVEIQEML